MSLTYDRANFELFNIEAGTIDIQSANLDGMLLDNQS